MEMSTNILVCNITIHNMCKYLDCLLGCQTVIILQVAPEYVVCTLKCMAFILSTWWQIKIEFVDMQFLESKTRVQFLNHYSIVYGYINQFSLTFAFIDGIVHYFPQYCKDDSIILKYFSKWIINLFQNNVISLFSWPFTKDICYLLVYLKISCLLFSQTTVECI